MKLGIAQMVLERAEFSHREDYLSMQANIQVPTSNVGLNVQVSRAEQDHTKALVRLIATSAEGAIYQFSVAYVAFLSLEVEGGEEIPEDIDRRLMVTGGSMLYPFVRETVATLSSKGRFGPTWLAPVDFNRILPTNLTVEHVATP
jgi:preprotein translocase subunit SecB